MHLFRKLYIRAIKIKFFTLLIAVLLFLILNTWVIRSLEPQTFENDLHAVWWLMTTMTTVGYGDVSPESAAGRIWTMLVIYPFGIGIFGLVIGMIVDSFSRHKKLKEEGKLMYKGKDHYIIIGWTLKSKEAAEELMMEEPETDILLIDELEKSPLTHERFHYINGSATNTSVLDQAGVARSKAVLIFAPPHIEDMDLADGRTLLIASSIEEYDTGTKTNIYTIAEILNKQHISMFRHANVDEFILSQHSASHLMAKSARHKGTSRIFSKLLNNGTEESELREILSVPEWRTYGDAFENLKKANILLISDENQLNVLQKLDAPLAPGTKLYVVGEAQGKQRS
ncbi:ion transporter [Bacillus mangrovi]|uniref:Ion transporter n=1 Tax=Metabacillus mangrovi TaxID=1491830 RepID=A0A7X2S4K6_9BACI|nr:potassium channel family protein [Metabacillus mangrovi]MTH53539.1 ion transporter [Metabacillus mangrovi]